MKNNKIINDFGDEWEKFNFSNFDQDKLYKIFLDYFNIFPLNKINSESIGFDLGGGTGRWSQFIAPKVKQINFVEPSKAIKVAKQNLKNFKNISYINNEISHNLFQYNSQDFGYCLGVLHHTKNPIQNLSYCVSFLKKDAPFLLYLYYKLENRSIIYRLIWKLSDIFRFIISSLPNFIKNIITDIIAISIYLPFSRFSLLLSKLQINTSSIPLSYYKDKPFYILRNDSRDRFGTKLEKRFTKKEIEEMMLSSGLHKIKFSNKEPFWVAIGYKKSS